MTFGAAFRSSNVEKFKENVENYIIDRNQVRIKISLSCGPVVVAAAVADASSAVVLVLEL